MTRILKSVIFFSLFLLILAGQFHPITDLSNDLSRHLLLGKIFFQNHQIITVNTFSYTYPQFPYLNYSWLTEIIFYLLSSTIGINGLILLKDLVVMTAFLPIFLYTRQKFNLLLISFSALAYLLIFLDRTPLRPEIFSYLFLSIFITTLFRFRARYSKNIFLLIPLQLLWVNMHIYFVIGLLLVAMFLVESIIQFGDKFKSNYVISLSKLLAGMVIASCFNPHGITGFFYPLGLFQNYGIPIGENLNIFNFESLYPHTILLSTLSFKVLSAVLMFLPFFVWKKTRLIDWLISGVFIIFGFSAVRNLQLFVFLTFIPFCYVLSSFVEGFIEKAIFKKNTRLINSSLVSLFFICLTALMGFEIKSHGLGLGSVVTGQKAVDFFIANNLKGPILNDFDTGSYLEYRLYPKERVFVDGRPEAYPKEFFQNTYIPLLIDKDKFKQLDDKYRFNTIVLTVTNPDEVQLITNINSSHNWNQAYLDQNIVIFTK